MATTSLDPDAGAPTPSADAASVARRQPAPAAASRDALHAPRLSVVIVARDEAERIGTCLDAVDFADERLVVDTGSVDGTREVATAHGARVEELPWRGFGATKAAALELARGDWILLLDADEEVGGTLARAIQRVVVTGRAGAAASGGGERDARDGRAPAGYELCRRSLFLGRWMRHGGWYPDWVLRLVRRGAFTMSLDAVHERLSVRGQVERLEGELRHHTDPDLTRYLAKMISYADLGARSLHDRGTRFRLRQLLARPPAVFFKRYVLRAGYRDGLQGFLLAALSAVHVLVKYARLWELERLDRAPAEDG